MLVGQACSFLGLLHKGRESICAGTPAAAVHSGVPCDQYQHIRCTCCAAWHLHACRIAAFTKSHRSWSMMMAQHITSSRLQAGQQQVTMNGSMRSPTASVAH
jgi:hypothetical protein